MTDGPTSAGSATATGPRPVHLAGNSLGGRVALECALALPSQVRSLLLEDPAGVGRETFINFRLATVPWLGEVLTLPHRGGLKMLWRRAYADRALLPEPVIRGTARPSASMSWRV